MKHTPAFVSSVECWSLLSWIESHAVTSSAAIPCAIVAVELYSSHIASSSPIMHVIVAIGHDVMTHCQSVPSPRHIPDLVRSYFELVQRALVFCPSSIVSDAEFPPILHLAIACLMDLNQREALRAVVVCVNHVVAKREAPPLVQFQSIVDTVLTAQLTPLWVAIMTLLTSTGPTTVLPTVSHLAFGLLTAFGNDMHMAAVADAMLSQHHLFESTPLYTTNYEERKFTAFVKDFAKVCRKELPVEHLVDHFVALQDK
ncbi:hypothetical protein DYB30_004769 [Aphanomyces astaci]|uniref:Exportin-1 C-terminal domain-containing protein n=1 Tax=Aphanomyces astaci TaxID=112090 RepID=A0A397C712_APHAT|nr:hypothetical protein DYB38_005116 [Aphanomyces astaci]RHY78899.1 hypothetical protein DYB30_004769 [Aphanomyces astaci]